MDINLYVYDLSRGLARQMSRQFLGIQIDAVYHTSLVFGNREYFFGAGVQTCYPGSTHLGRPMEVIPMGQTSIPQDLIADYLESLKQVYTPESYDLFAHNCNNFSNDFAMFLVGKGIPHHITSLPQTVLNTPFGQMLRPQIDSAMRPIVQAPAPTAPSPSASKATTTLNPALLSHPHRKLPLPLFRRATTQPVTYTKLPPLEKLVAKLGEAGKSPIVTDITAFISARNKHGAQEAPLPDLVAFSSFLTTSVPTLPLENRFAAYDLLRLLLVDQRVSGFFLQPDNLSTLTTLIDHVTQSASCPYSVCLVAIHACCNLSSSPLLWDSAFSNPAFASALVSLLSNNLLDKDHANLRTAAASLAYNICTAQYVVRTQSRTDSKPTPSTSELEPGLPQGAQVELVAAILEALASETESQEAIRGLVLALARLVYCAESDGEVLDLCRATEAKDVVNRKMNVVRKEDRELVKEIGEVLLGKGL